MRTMRLVLLLAFLSGCAETVRCPDGEVFDDDGDCEPITDRPTDAGAPADATSGDS